ncbi:MAG TPA: DUF6786 family protein [Planctomycetota bacterium]|jgi:hypothetical protein|nr:DUF6786 family protein [Planctomycetota bacterium]
MTDRMPRRAPIEARLGATLALGALALPAAAQTGPPRPDAVFARDVQFLKDFADAVVLEAPGGGKVVVSPKLSGRVMTSAFSDNEPGFGLVNREAITRPPVARGFSNYGGEDRLWLAPEGGPYGLFFDPGAKQELANWYVPPAMDGGVRTPTGQDAASISFHERIALKNVEGVAFDLTIDRKVEALAKDELERVLGAALPEGAKFVAFRTTNKVTNEAKVALPADALVAPWVLGQFRPSPKTTVLLPYQGAEGVIKKDYFGVVPPDRLALVPEGDGGVARFKGDAQLRSKIGVSAAGALGWLGAWDAQHKVLTLVNHSLPPAGAVVPDCNWTVPNPRAKSGDVATSYNHGEEPRFFELESIGPALGAAPKSSVTQVQTTIHLAAEPAALAEIAKKLLRATL